MHLFSSQFIFSACLSHGHHQDKAACPYHAHRRQARAWEGAFYTAASKLCSSSGLNCQNMGMHSHGWGASGFSPGTGQNGLFISFAAGTLTVVNVIILLQLLLPVWILSICMWGAHGGSRFQSPWPECRKCFPWRSATLWVCTSLIAWIT